MGTFYHGICQTELIPLNCFLISINVILISMQLYLAADIFLDQLYIYLVKTVKLYYFNIFIEVNTFNSERKAYFLVFICFLCGADVIVSQMFFHGLRIGGRTKGGTLFLFAALPEA